MKVFLNMGLTEHTGHGVPTIIKKYGKEIFEFTDNMPITNYMNSNKYICAIRDAFTIMMPVVIVGSFAWLANYSKIFNTVNFACISCMSLWLVFLMGYILGGEGQKSLLSAPISNKNELM